MKCTFKYQYAFFCSPENCLMILKSSCCHLFCRLRFLSVYIKSAIHITFVHPASAVSCSQGGQVFSGNYSSLFALNQVFQSSLPVQQRKISGSGLPTTPDHGK